MKIKLKTIFFIFLLGLLNLYLSSTATGKTTGKTTKIFLVHSYHPSYVWVKEYKKGIMDGLKERLDGRFEIGEIYLDAKRHPENLKVMAYNAYKRYLGYKPDIVIAADDPAQGFFVVPYLSNKVKTPVVFLGVNGALSDYNYPSDNVTGILERMNNRENINLIHSLVPGAKRFGVIMDKSITATTFLKRWKERENLRFDDFEFDRIYIAGTFKEWKDYILRLQKEVDAIYILSYFALKDENGRYIEPKKVVQWYVRHSRIPEVTENIFSVKSGLLCSYGQSSYLYGKKAAEIACDIIINGKKVKDIPVVILKRGLRVINRTRARTLGITIPPELIPGTIFYD